MIATSSVLRYRASCENCGWHGPLQARRAIAEADMRQHKCGEHRVLPYSQHRGILGGWSQACVCGHGWNTDGPLADKCPRSD